MQAQRTFTRSFQCVSIILAIITFVGCGASSTTEQSPASRVASDVSVDNTLSGGFAEGISVA